MLEAYTYKNFNIEYDSLTGTTIIYDLDLIIRRFKHLGYQEGEKKAKEYVDWLLKNIDRGEE